MNPKGKVPCGEQQFDNCHDKIIGEIDYYIGCARELDNEEAPHINSLFVNETDWELLKHVMELLDIVPENMGGCRGDHLAKSAKLVVHNKGARITGSAGVCKTQ